MPATDQHLAHEAGLEQIEQALTTVVRWATLPRLHGRLNAEAGVTLDRPGYVLLTRIADQGGCRVSDLAARIGLDLSTVSRKVARLEAERLVARRIDPADRRSVTVELTAKGRKVLAKVRAARLASLQDLLAGWPVADRAELANLLGNLSDALRRDTERFCEQQHR